MVEPNGVAVPTLRLGNTGAATTSAVTYDKSLSKIAKILFRTILFSEFLVGNFGVVRKSESKR